MSSLLVLLCAWHGSYQKLLAMASYCRPNHEQFIVDQIMSNLLSTKSWAIYCRPKHEQSSCSPLCLTWSYQTLLAMASAPISRSGESWYQILHQPVTDTRPAKTIPTITTIAHHTKPHLPHDDRYQPSYLFQQNHTMLYTSNKKPYPTLPIQNDQYHPYHTFPAYHTSQKVGLSHI